MSDRGDRIPEGVPGGAAWIRSLRGPKNRVDPFRPYHMLVERERTLRGTVEEVITLFLTNRECSYTCLMCDLWKNTTDDTVPAGAIPAQIEWALSRLPHAPHIKLYNSGNFFDPRAVPPADYPRIAELLRPFQTVVVENHPGMTGERVAEFAGMLRPRLQVAMGLETVHPWVLARLQKKMDPGDFGKAVDKLRRLGIGSRAFILLKPPFMSEQEGIRWARASLDHAFGCGVECCTVIPVRAGNGAMEHLEKEGHFTPPLLSSLEEVTAYGIGLKRGNVFADTWDLGLFSRCDRCFAERKSRLETMNLTQEVLPVTKCTCQIRKETENIDLTT
jgi:radical SAM enzyme (TIGR01210 family)